MIKKILISIGLSAVLLNASPMSNITDNVKTINKEQQRQINTKADYIELEKLLKSLVSQGDVSKAIVLGTLYMNRLTLKNGEVIPADTKKAKEVLEYALYNKKPFAAFYLSIMEKPYNALLTLEQAIKSKYTTKEIQEVLAIRYNEIILNDFYLNFTLVKKALKLTLPIANATNDNPTLDFSVAHLLFIDKQNILASKYINSACNNPRADKRLLMMCQNDPLLLKNGKMNAVTNNKCSNADF